MKDKFTFLFKSLSFITKTLWLLMALAVLMLAFQGKSITILLMLMVLLIVISTCFDFILLRDFVKNRNMIMIKDNIISSWRSFWTNFRHSIVIVFSIILAICILCIVLSSYSSELINSFNIISYALSIFGVIFGILSYTVTLRVEKTIRNSITDFREFVHVACDIINQEVEFCKKIQKPIIEKSHVEPSTQLILVLWFPYFGLTTDFSPYPLDTLLADAKRHDCPTKLITSEKPLEFLDFFDKHYSDEAKKYSVDEFIKLKRDFDKTQTITDWSESLLCGNGYGDILKKCMRDLASLHGYTNFWKVKRFENDTLMSGNVQIVWTAKKAAMVFMPPNFENIENRDNIFQCSGFSTEDPCMINMMRELIKMRFESIKSIASDEKNIELENHL